jgi:hypothetical protein
MPEVGFPVMPGGYLEKAIAGEYAGTEVTVDGPFTDPDDQRFFESMEAFEEATGITINYIGDKEFEARLSISVDAGDAPDIADFPQPGKAAGYARQGHIVDPTSWMSNDWLTQQYNQSWLDMGKMAGQTAGVWHRFNANGDSGLKLFVADVVDVNAGCFFKGGDGTVHLHAVGVVAFKRTIYGDGCPRELARQGTFQETARHHSKASVRHLCHFFLFFSWTASTGCASRPGSVNLLHSRVQINGTSHIAGDLFPEGASAHFARHQV